MSAGWCNTNWGLCTGTRRLASSGRVWQLQRVVMCKCVDTGELLSPDCTVSGRAEACPTPDPSLTHSRLGFVSSWREGMADFTAVKMRLKTCKIYSPLISLRFSKCAFSSHAQWLLLFALTALFLSLFVHLLFQMLRRDYLRTAKWRSSFRWLKEPFWMIAVRASSVCQSTLHSLLMPWWTNLLFALF